MMSDLGLALISLRASSPIWASETSLARSREARFACPNRRACSQAIGEETYPSGFLQGNTVLFIESLIADLHV